MQTNVRTRPERYVPPQRTVSQPASIIVPIGWNKPNTNAKRKSEPKQRSKRQFKNTTRKVWKPSGSRMRSRSRSRNSSNPSIRMWIRMMTSTKAPRQSLHRGFQHNLQRYSNRPFTSFYYKHLRVVNQWFQHMTHHTTFPMAATLTRRPVSMWIHCQTVAKTKEQHKQQCGCTANTGHKELEENIPQ